MFIRELKRRRRAFKREIEGVAIFGIEKAPGVIRCLGQKENRPL